MVLNADMANQFVLEILELLYTERNHFSTVTVREMTANMANLDNIEQGHATDQPRQL